MRLIILLHTKAASNLSDQENNIRVGGGGKEEK